MQTAVLSAMYLTAVGYVMVFTGILIDIDVGNIDYIRLHFAGGFLTTLFWVCYINVQYLPNNY
jgi:hypothetical protein